MMKETTMATIGDDPEVRQARQALRGAQQALDEANAKRKALAPEVGSAAVSLRLLEASAEVERAAPVRDEAARRLETLERKARERLVAERRPGRVERLKRLLEAAVAAHEAAVALQAYDQETAGGGGLAVGEPPLPQLLGLRDQLERLRRLIDPPKPPRPEPPPAGTVRVQIVERVMDREHFGRILYPGDRVDFSEDVAADLIQRKLAVEVK